MPAKLYSLKNVLGLDVTGLDVPGETVNGSLNHT